jgi:hypothetical protein
VLSRGSRALASRRFPIFPATGHQSECSGWGTPGASLVALAVRVQEEWEPQPLSETIGSVDDDYELADQRFTLEAACRKLPVRERLVLHMRFIEDRTQTDIAATIGLSQMQVSRILRGATERLELAARPALEYWSLLEMRNADRVGARPPGRRPTPLWGVPFHRPRWGGYIGR